jgi:hypothetical protein
VTTILLTFMLFAVALTAMAVGVLLSGRHLKGSCGGAANDVAEDSLLGDCVCARKEADICASDEGNEFVMLAELGNPSRKDYFREQRRGRQDPPPQLEV